MIGLASIIAHDSLRLRIAPGDERELATPSTGPVVIPLPPRLQGVGLTPVGPPLRIQPHLGLDQEVLPLQQAPHLLLVGLLVLEKAYVGSHPTAASAGMLRLPRLGPRQHLLMGQDHLQRPCPRQASSSLRVLSYQVRTAISRLSSARSGCRRVCCHVHYGASQARVACARIH